VISLVPELRRPLLRPPPRNPLPFLPRPGPGREPGSSFDFVGTAHFTGRSIYDAIQAASSGLNSGVAVELDRARFDGLNRMGYSVGPQLRARAEGEFVAATDAFGNRDGDIWLLDWSIEQIDRRVRMTLTPQELWRWRSVSSDISPYEIKGAGLWEAGLKDEALHYLDFTTSAMREYFPSLYRVLIIERNLLMAGRLMEVESQLADPQARLLVLMGMAHIEGVRELLREPERVSEGFDRYGLNYSSPIRIRRARVN